MLKHLLNMDGNLIVLYFHQLGSITYSIFIQGTDWNNKKIVYARVETSSVSAGQTFIYWEDCFRKMTDILNNIPVERRLAVAEKEGNKEEIIKISVEELF